MFHARSPEVVLNPSITVEKLIEKARHLARLSRDEMLGSLRIEMIKMRAAGAKEEDVSAYGRVAQESRMDIVMDCYLTGCAEMLKMIHGDDEPEPWAQYAHSDRIGELIAKYSSDPLQVAFCEGRDIAIDNAAMLCHDLGFPELRNEINRRLGRNAARNDQTESNKPQ